jgi:hypothetical protein
MPNAIIGNKFSLVLTSDPQFPWYDDILPPGLTSKDERLTTRHGRSVNNTIVLANLQKYLLLVSSPLRP